MSVFIASVICLLCLGFDSTRSAGVAGLVLLSLMYPPLLVALLILFFIHNQ